MRRFGQFVVLQRSFASAAKKGGGKAKGGGAGAAAPTGAVGDFPLDEMYPDLKLGSLTKADLPSWAKEELALVFPPKGVKIPPPGPDERKFYKLERRKKIKEDNERRALGVQ
jgi:hypothetical protein